MGDLIVCSRFMTDDSTIRQSHAGISLRGSNGVVHTCVFDSLDRNVSVLVDGMHDGPLVSNVWHVFVSRYAAQLTDSDYEVFRLHQDQWPVQFDEEPFLYGVETHRTIRHGQFGRYSFEHLGGPYYTHPNHLTSIVMAGSGFTRCLTNLVPEREVYRLTYTRLPHPGMSWEGHEADAIEDWIRRSKGQEVRIQ